MRRVVIVRHAATEWTGRRFCGRADPPLSDEGTGQLAPLGRALRALALAGVSVWTSPARRAVATAEAVAAAYGCGIDRDERLREVDFGLAEGRTFGEIERSWPRIAAALLDGAATIDWPAGETAAAVTARLGSVADALSHAESDVVVVTHGFVARRLLSFFEIAMGPPLGPARFVAFDARAVGGPAASTAHEGGSHAP